MLNKKILATAITLHFSRPEPPIECIKAKETPLWKQKQANKKPSNKGGDV